MQKLNAFIFYICIFIFILFNKSGGGTGFLLGTVIILSFFYLLSTNLTYAFLLCAVILSNPGPIMTNDSFGMTTHYLRFKDIIFYCAFLFYLLKPLARFPLDKRISKLMPYLIIFTGYQIVVSLMLNLEVSAIPAIINSLIVDKIYIFGIFLIIPAYKVIQLDSKLFLRELVLLSGIFGLVFLLSSYSPLKIVEIPTSERMEGMKAVRYLVNNAQIFIIIIFAGLSIYFVKTPVKKIWFYLASLFTLAIPIIGMYRLESFFTFATIFITFYLINKYYNVKFFKLINLSFYFLLGISLLFILWPTFSNAIFELYKATFEELSGNAAAGSTQTRTIIELPKHLRMIRENPFFGNGFRAEWWQNFSNRNDWGLSDIPFTATLAMYGFIGMIIYYSRFTSIFKTMGIIHRFIKQNFNKIAESDNIEILLIFSLSAYFVTMVTFRLFYIGWELTLDKLPTEFGICLGIYYGLINVIMNKYKPAENQQEQLIDIVSKK